MSTMPLIDRWIMAFIRFYQRWISPYKGFRCAHGLLHGGDSCSQFALQTVERGGWVRLWNALPRRLDACRAAAHLLQLRPASRTSNESSQGQQAENPLLDGAAHGVEGCLDVGCDLASAGDCGDVANCCSADFF